MLVASPRHAKLQLLNPKGQHSHLTLLVQAAGWLKRLVLQGLCCVVVSEAGFPYVAQAVPELLLPPVSAPKAQITCVRHQAQLLENTLYNQFHTEK